MSRVLSDIQCIGLYLLFPVNYPKEVLLCHLIFGLTQCCPGWEGVRGEVEVDPGHDDEEGAGDNCIKICLPGKQILSKRKSLREVLFS